MNYDKNNKFDYKNGVNLIKSSLNKLQMVQGLQIVGQHEDILYVGKAKNLRKRVSSYSNISKHSNRIKLLVSSVKKLIIWRLRVDSFILE